MNKLLVVVDMQNDFITGVLGTPEARAIIPNVVKKIEEWEGDICVTKDTHTENYLNTQEGKNLPIPHCIEDTWGHWGINEVTDAIFANKPPLYIIDKYTFGSSALPELIRGKNYDYIELIGVCTGICVISNAIILKANFPETHIAVDASCCACVTPESHKAALTTMKMCQIDVIGFGNRINDGESGMNDNDTIKALECCRVGKDNCKKCPLYCNEPACSRRMAEFALDLINRQKAEIEKLTINMNAFGLGMKREKERADTIRTEAIKEFAEKIKAKLDISVCGYSTEEVISDIVNTIDDIMKEMTEGDNG